MIGFESNVLDELASEERSSQSAYKVDGVRYIYGRRNLGKKLGTLARLYEVMARLTFMQFSRTCSDPLRLY